MVKPGRLANARRPWRRSWNAPDITLPLDIGLSYRTVPVVNLHQDVAEMFTVGKNRTAIQIISLWVSHRCGDNQPRKSSYSLCHGAEGLTAAFKNGPLAQKKSERPPVRADGSGAGRQRGSDSRKLPLTTPTARSWLRDRAVLFRPRHRSQPCLVLAHGLTSPRGRPAPGPDRPIAA